jgi:hypothetical protein
MLKQSGMASGTMKCNGTSFVIEFIKIHTALLHQSVLLPESFCIKRFKHRLIVRIVRIIPFKVFNHLCKGMKPLGRDLPARNSHAFLNSGY